MNKSHNDVNYIAKYVNYIAKYVNYIAKYDNIFTDISFCRSALMEQFSLVIMLTQVMRQIKIHFHWEVEEAL